MNTPRAYQTYQHYKGGLYLKLCDALHTETDEMMTVYICTVRGAVFTRPKAMFDEVIQEGIYKGPRFIPVPNDLTKDQAKNFLVMGGCDARQSA